MNKKAFTTSDVDKIARLANIPVTDEEKEDLARGFTTVVGVLEELKEIDVTDVHPTNQVTGLENVTREDEVDVTRMFTQEEALTNAKHTHNGFFVVDQVLDQE